MRTIRAVGITCILALALFAMGPPVRAQDYHIHSGTPWMGLGVVDQTSPTVIHEDRLEFSFYWTNLVAAVYYDPWAPSGSFLLWKRLDSVDVSYDDGSTWANDAGAYDEITGDSDGIILEDQMTIGFDGSYNTCFMEASEPAPMVDAAPINKWHLDLVGYHYLATYRFHYSYIIHVYWADYYGVGGPVSNSLSYTRTSHDYVP